MTEELFIKFKESLVSAQIPFSPDFFKVFTIQCVTNDTGVDGILTQKFDGEVKVISYAGHFLTKQRGIGLLRNVS